MEGEEEEIVGPFHRISARTRRMATRMASALASSDNRTQIAAAAAAAATSIDHIHGVVLSTNDQIAQTTKCNDLAFSRTELQWFTMIINSVYLCRELAIRHTVDTFNRAE
uniref:Uncharacterized protein n=1 Tax=Oryza glumipatula TaxID=40148 RepID=A0A0D9Z7T4_9ORYZ